MQLYPDLSEVATSRKAERTLKNFKFKGAGLYLGKNSFMAVVPIIEQNGSLWNIHDNQFTEYNFYLYKTPLEDTIFGLVKDIPIRQDIRKDLDED